MVVVDVQPTSTGGRSRRSFPWLLAVAGLVVLGLVACWAYILLRPGHPNPDPGHARLHLLEPVTEALPADAHVRGATIGKPRWDSCDGRAGTFGWDDVTAFYPFTSNQPPAVFIDHAMSVLRSQGWTVHRATDPSGAPLLTGSHPVPDGAMASVSLSATYQTRSGPLVYWLLAGDAPPAGPRASGC